MKFTKCFQLVLNQNETTPDENKLTIMRLGEQNVRVSLSQADDYQIQVFNLSGQLVVYKDFEGTSTDIRLPIPGLYVVRVFDGKYIYTKKTII